jgi:hypothetical protein
LIKIRKKGRKGKRRKGKERKKREEIVEESREFTLENFCRFIE